MFALQGSAAKSKRTAAHGSPPARGASSGRRQKPKVNAADAGLQKAMSSYVGKNISLQAENEQTVCGLKPGPHQINNEKPKPATCNVHWACA